MINRLIGKLQDLRRAYRAIAELNELDDRQLRDIGITRGDIRHIVLG